MPSFLRLRARGLLLRAAGALLSLSGLAGESAASIVVAEVYYDAAGADDGFEWIELTNLGAVPVDLASWSLGWGGADYGSGVLGLAGTIAPGARFVVGGPLSGAENASPRFDLAVDLAPDLQNSGTTADGVALFDLPVEELGPDSVPVSVVIYGEENASGLVDETGSPGAVDVADAPSGSSIELGLDGLWRIQPAPTPGAPPEPVPEPGGTPLAVAGLGALAACGLRRSARRASGGPGARARGACVAGGAER